MLTEFEEIVLEKIEDLEERLNKYEISMNRNSNSIGNIKQDLGCIEKNLNIITSMTFRGYATNGRIQAIQNHNLNYLNSEIYNHYKRISALEKKTTI